VGIVGYGVCQFGAAFSFQDHPNVQVVAVSDLIPERCAGLAKVCRCEKKYPSLEELVKDETIEAVFVATDALATRALHRGSQPRQTRLYGSPAFRGNIEDAEKLLECVKKNLGLVYAMFETSVFHNDLYAMEKLYAADVFAISSIPKGSTAIRIPWVRLQSDRTRTGARTARPCGIRRTRWPTTSA